MLQAEDLLLQTRLSSSTNGSPPEVILKATRNGR